MNLSPEQTYFNREFYGMVDAYDPEELRRCKMAEEIESFKAAISLELEQGDSCDVELCNQSVAIMNELSRELGHIGRVKIDGDLMIKVGNDSFVPYTFHGEDARLSGYEIRSYVNEEGSNVHMLTSNFDGLLLGDEVVEGYGITDDAVVTHMTA